MTKLQILLVAALFSPALTPAAHAQCADSRITSAFQLALNRQPTQTECNANRYAGGAFSTSSDLVPLVKASVVCSDPWIAQAYYQLNLPLNGHPATTLDPSGPGSTTNQCNYAIYGSWSNFPQLKTLVTQHFSPVATNTAPALARVTITGPATMVAGANATLTWTNGAAVPACSSGYAVQASGGKFGSNYQVARVVSLASGTFTFPIGTGITSTQQITLHIFDLCHGAVISNDYSATLMPGAPAAPAASSPTTGLIRTVAPVATVTLSGLDSQGCLINSAGQKLSPTETCHLYLVSSSGVYAPGSYQVQLNGKTITPTVASGQSGVLTVSPGVPVRIVSPSSGTWEIVAAGGGNVVNTNGSNIVAAGGGNIVAAGGGNIVAAGGGNIVAAGGGNIVAAGGGNIVAAGGGNIVAAGGGNIVAAGGGNFQFLDPATAARNTGLLINGVSLIGNDGSSFQASLANLANISKFVGNNASAMVSTSPMYNTLSVSTNQAARITGPQTWTYGQPAMVTWSLAQANASCPSGVHVTVNGVTRTANIAISAGRAVVPWVNMARGSKPTLSLACGTSPFSPPVSTTIQ